MRRAVVGPVAEEDGLLLLSKNIKRSFIGVWSLF
jgi:hypothetical protein